MEVSISLAQWVVGKALAPVTDHLLESWAASAGLSPNIDALKMELLYAQGMLENTQGMDIRSSALKELLQKLRHLAYRADDVLDKLVYFRIQDALDGTYHAADVHELGCVDALFLNACHIAKDVASTLKFPSCSCAASHGDPPDEQEYVGKQGCLSGVLSSGGRQISSNKVASHASRDAAHAVGKHFPSNCFPSMARYRDRAVQTTKLEFNRVEMSKKMVDIVEQLKPVCAKVSTILNLELLNLNRLNNSHTLSEKNALNRPRITPPCVEPVIYGRDNLAKKILDSIKHEYCTNQLTVLPIVGSGGIGKTTLTHHVYKELESHFHISIWICVSVNFSSNRLARNIVKMIPKVRGEDENASHEELIEQRLKDKKFLLVLDDVWKCHKDDWNKLLAPFKKGRTIGNIIIVTTRFPKVVKMVRTIDYSIELDRLEPEDMMDFFEACVFGEDQHWEDHYDLHEIGLEIVKRLNGSPLAAKAVGRLLRNQLTRAHWAQVLESKEWESQNNSTDIMSALRLSYDNLPFSLRHCVAYCGLFPEDYEFDTKELIQLWIALGILNPHPSEQNKRLEDVGMRYINDLVTYGFLLVKRRENGCPYYLIHDLVHELAILVLPYECLRIHSSNVGTIQIPASVRHLSIIVDDIDVWDRSSFEQYKTDLSALGKRLKVEDLRTLMLFGEHHGSFAKILGELCREARALRIVILSGASYSVDDMFHNFPELVHLRYLRIKSTNKKDIFLPSALFRYYHLEIIDLEDWHGYFGSTRHMSNLVKLRYFLVPKDELHVHSNILEVGKLKLLEELGRFVVRKESTGFKPSQLGKLKNIGGSLGIHNLERVQTQEEAEEIELIDKTCLRELILEWDTDRLNTDPLQEESVLEGLVPPRNVTELCIRGHGGASFPTWLDGNILDNNLESLCLYDIAWENLPLGSQSTGFGYLKRLELVRLPKLKKFSGNEPRSFLLHLEVFIVEDCVELFQLPFSLNQDPNISMCPRLRELRIVNCRKLVSLPRVPWTLAPCSADIARAGSSFEHLAFSEIYKSEPRLSIKGTDGQGSMLWNGLAFSNLINLAELEMEKCPPLPLAHLQQLRSLKFLQICDSSNLLLAVEVGRHVECSLPLEDVSIRRCDATGKELTWLLSQSPKITKLSIEYCGMITELGVAEREKMTPASSSAGKMQQQTRGGEEEIAAEGLLLLPPQLQELEVLCCPELHLLSSSVDDDKAAVDGGLHGLLSLHTLKIRDCAKFLSYCLSSSPGCFLPASLEKLTLASVKSIQTLDSLSNLTSLTNLSIYGCGELVGEGLWPLITMGQLSRLIVYETPKFFTSRPHDKGLPSGSSKLQHLQTDDVAGVLAASICSLISSSLTNLSFSKIQEAKRYTKLQEKALHLLTSLEELQFDSCDSLQRLPAGLTSLTKLKRLQIRYCPTIRKLPKNGLPSSLQELEITSCPAFESLPKKGLPSSLRELNVSDSNSEKLIRQCRKLNGTIPIIRA